MLLTSGYLGELKQEMAMLSMTNDETIEKWEEYVSE